MKNKNGFTIAELIATVTIMGILLLITVPVVSRTIQNSRRDLFATLAKDYMEAVENSVTGDELVCNINNKWVPVSVIPKGKYFFPICTSSNVANCHLIGGEGIGTYMTREDVVESTEQLFDSFKTSPFGDNHLKGYVVWEVKDSSYGEENMTESLFKIRLEDVSWNGISEEVPMDQLKRQNVKTRDKKSGSDNMPTNNIMTLGYKPCKFK